MQKKAVNISVQVFYDALGAELQDSSIIDYKMQEAYKMIREKSSQRKDETEKNAEGERQQIHQYKKERKWCGKKYALPLGAWWQYYVLRSLSVS